MGARRGAVGGLAITAVTALALAACSSGAAEDTASATGDASATSSAAGGDGATGGSAPATSAEPTDVATDPPLEAPEGGDVTVVLTYADWDQGVPGVTVGAYVEAVAESGGTCTLTLEGQGRTASARVPGEREPGSTSCPGLTVPGEELASGTWTATVTYESDEYSGTSEPLDVVVP
ncbi:hypothetical protein ACI796_09090 [Geodermatophilus sp. SYSU D00525]